MRGLFPLGAMACVAIVTSVSCKKVESLKPPRPLPTGTLMIHFTTKIAGPVDLLIDGVRIQVAPRKKATSLVVEGLAPGTHSYFLSSPREAFGPDRGQVVLPAEGGLYLVNFASTYNAVLYGKPDPLPPTDGLPGVKARLEP